MVDAPRGTVTMLFTDIEGSTRLLQALGRDAWVEALTAHGDVLRDVLARHGGIEAGTDGDSFFYVFGAARDAVVAAAAAQRALASHAWPSEKIRVRMGLHTGEPAFANDDYTGLDVHRAARIMSAAHGGQILVSARTADFIAAEPPDGLSLRDLGVHRLKDLLEPQRLFQLVGEGLEADFPLPATLENRPTNLPVQPTPLVGREHELRETSELLVRRDVRLLTLTGPGGTGKTRLALQLAADRVDDFPGGVYLVTLAPLSDPAQLAPAIAQTLGVGEQPREDAEQTLASHLAERRVLLVLDNFEHLAEAASLVARLLARAPELKLLVTSRAPLHLSAEHEYPVPPLATEEALALFTDRAQAAKPSFVLNGNRQLVVEICLRLDNLPLAIELAAARIKLLPEQAVLERLDQRLKLLTGGARDLPARQQTLQAAIDWSYNLLSGDEQKLFRRFAVFAGGASFEAIEAVCDPAELDVFEGVASLVDKSLLRQEQGPTAQPRFGMLETIREYAQRQLESADEAHDAGGRHARHFAELAAATRERMKAGDEAASLAILETELENLRSALEWTLAAGDADLAARLCDALNHHWYHRMLLSECRRWAMPTLAIPGGTDRIARWRVLTLSSEILGMVGDIATAEQLLNEAVAIADELGDPWFIAGTSTFLGHLASTQGDYARARARYERTLAIDDEYNPGPMTGANNRVNLGWALMLEGDLDRAEEVLTEGLRLARQASSLMVEAGISANLAHVAVRRGDHESTEAHAANGLRIAADVGEHRVVEETMTLLSWAAAGRSDWARAALLTGAAEPIRERAGTGITAFVGGQERLDRAREALGEEEWHERVAFGKSLSLEDAVRYALTESE